MERASAANRNPNPAWSATLVMAGILVSRILGFVRERAVADLFGRTPATDAYWAAFAIPDLMYYLLIGGALGSAFIPVFTEYLAKEKEQEAWYVASSFINGVVVIMLGFVALGMVFAPLLAPLVAYEFKGEQFRLLVFLMRMMFPAVFFTALSGVGAAILNSYRRFGIPAFGPIAYNLCIIAAAYLLGPKYDIPGMAVGVVIGALVNFSLEAWFAGRHNAGYRLVIDLHHPGPRKMLRLFLPTLLGLSIAQINLLVNQNLASGLSGGITALRLANRLMQLPLGLFATAISTVIFPTMTRQAALNQMDDFRRSVATGLQVIYFITVPASVGLIVLAEPIVRLLYQTGRFTAADTAATAIALVYYSLGLFTQSAVQHLTRVYYSLQDTTTPVRVGLLTVAANIAMSAWFVKVARLGHGGVALAFALTSLLDMVFLLWLLRSKLHHLHGRAVLTSFLKSAVASLIMGAVVWEAVRLVDGRVNLATNLGRLIEVGTGVATGAVVYLLAALLLRMEEVPLILRLFRRRAATA
ncbi:MAG: murein biosynthesis integral membrane protein MurJ [Bacillota bacterium]|nr:murein biosynthesis integral membrane protein MurJ [Bacillota bacterium]